MKKAGVEKKKSRRSAGGAAAAAGNDTPPRKQTAEKDVYLSFAEKVRDHKGLESRWAVLQETRVEYFRGKDFVAFLRNHSEVSDILELDKNLEPEDIGNTLLKKNLIVRCDRVVKTLRPGKKKLSTWPAHLEIYPVQTFSDNDAFFVWTFVKRHPLWQTLLSFSWPVLTLAICLFPVYPHKAKLVVLYSCAGILLLIMCLLLCTFSVAYFVFLEAYHQHTVVLLVPWFLNSILPLLISYILKVGSAYLPSVRVNFSAVAYYVVANLSCGVCLLSYVFTYFTLLFPFLMGLICVRATVFSALWILLGKRVWIFPNILAEEATLSELFRFWPKKDEEEPPKWTARLFFTVVAVVFISLLRHHAPDEAARARYQKRVSNIIDDVLEWSPKLALSGMMKQADIVNGTDFQNDTASGSESSSEVPPPPDNVDVEDIQEEGEDDNEQNQRDESE